MKVIERFVAGLVTAVAAAVSVAHAATSVELSSGWRAKCDARHVGLEEGWEKAVPADAVPATMPYCGFETAPNCSEVWLYNDFVADFPSGARVFLELGRIQYLSTVWLNGERIGEYRGAYGLFDFDVTGKLRDGRNSLVLNVRTATKDFAIDGRNWDQMPVRSGHLFVQQTPVLRVRGAAAIVDVATDPDPRTGRLNLSVELDATADGPVELTADVRENGKPALICSSRVTVEAKKGRGRYALPSPGPIPNFRRWSPDDPTYYRVTVRAPGEEVSAKAGFRELRVDGSGYFELNGKRIFLKSAHMCAYLPFACNIPVQLPRLHFTLLYLKACGFNAVRFLLEPAHPELIDLCDDIGLMVYEEHPMSWLKKAGEDVKLAQRLFRESMTEIVRRDRNHPAFAAFGMLNEVESVKEKIPYLDAARDFLPAARALAPGLLYFYGSGRWDLRVNQASASNPRSSAWDVWMGKEGPNAKRPKAHGPWFACLGDFHYYPNQPIDNGLRGYFRRKTNGSPHAEFVSESGIGSAVNVIHEYLRYAQDGVCTNAPAGDYAIAQRQVAALRKGFRKYNLYSIWPTPEAMIQASQEFNSEQRARLTTAIRRCEKVSGYSVTMAQDLGLRGEGLLETSGAFKRGTTDMLEEQMADLRFCVSAARETVYAGESVELDVELSDFGVLKPDVDYPVALRIVGGKGVVWEKSVTMRQRLAADGKPVPVVSLFSGKVDTTGWAPGVYRVGAEILEGAHAECGTMKLTLVDPKACAMIKGRTVFVSGGATNAVASFFRRNGADVCEAKVADIPSGATVFVGNAKLADGDIDALVRLAQGGGNVILLSKATVEGALGRLPLKERGRARTLNNWLYHADSVLFGSSLTVGTLEPGIFDTAFFAPVWSDDIIEGIAAPDVPGVMSAYIGKGEGADENDCRLGLQLGAYRTGEGWIVLCTLNVEKACGTPAADILLRNMVNFCHAIENPTTGKHNIR